MQRLVARCSSIPPPPPPPPPTSTPLPLTLHYRMEESGHAVSPDQSMFLFLKLISRSAPPLSFRSSELIFSCVSSSKHISPGLQRHPHHRVRFHSLHVNTNRTVPSRRLSRTGNCKRPRHCCRGYGMDPGSLPPCTRLVVPPVELSAPCEFNLINECSQFDGKKCLGATFTNARCQL